MAWTKFFEGLRLAPTLEEKGLSCLRAEILGVCFVPQQPLFSVRIKVVDAIMEILKRTARTDDETEREDDSEIQLLKDSKLPDVLLLEEAKTISSTICSDALLNGNVKLNNGSSKSNNINALSSPSMPSAAHPLSIGA